MYSPKRTESWKQVIRKHGPGFLKWLDENGIAFRRFDKLASEIESHLLDVLTNCSYSEVGEQQCYEEFVAAIPKVLARCDEDIYENLLVAEAYAYVHLLERYRRFWSVLVELTKKGILPMRDTGAEVLDVGMGPAPALFAVEDYYQAIREYSNISAIRALDTPPPEIHSVESSYAMIHVAQVLAKQTGKRGPLQTQFDDFKKLDLEEARLSFRDETQNQLDDELGWMSYPIPEGYWRGKYLYNLMIFSNFLTQPESLAELKTAIREVFHGLRAGGVVVVVGGTEAHYPQIYDMIEKLAVVCDVQLMNRLPKVIPCSYSDIFANRIKRTYVKVWQHLEERFTDLGKWKPVIPNDLWNEEMPLRGPKQFGLRVFRKVWDTSRTRIQPRK